MSKNQAPEEVQSIAGLDLSTLEENVPDKLHPILEFVVKNLKAIGLAMGALILVVGIYAGVETWNQHKLEQKNTELGEITVRTAGETKIADLEKFIASASGGIKTQALFELAAASLEAGQYDKAEAAFKSLSGLVGPNLKMTASLGEVKAMMLAGKYAEAVAALQALKGSAPDYYKVVINQFTAVSAEMAGNWPVALGAYTELASNVDEGNRRYLESKIKELQAKI